MEGQTTSDGDGLDGLGRGTDEGSVLLRDPRLWPPERMSGTTEVSE